MTQGKLILALVIILIVSLLYFNWDLAGNDTLLGAAILVCGVFAWVIGIAGVIILLTQIIINTWDTKLPFKR